MIRAAQPLGACPGGRAPRQNWGKFEAHKWGGFTGRLEVLLGEYFVAYSAASGPIRPALRDSFTLDLKRHRIS